MLVTSPDEALSASGEGSTPDASRASEQSQKRESVRNVYIGDDELLSSVTTLDKNATLTDYRKECLNLYFSLYPDGAKVSPLPESERFPMEFDGDVASRLCMDVESGELPHNSMLPPLTGLYQKMKLSREAAKRMSIYERDLEKRWYVFRQNYGVAASVLDSLQIPDCDIYIPDVRHSVKLKGVKKIVSEPYLKNIFFAFTTRRIAGIIHESPLAPHTRIYYDHFQKDPLTGLNPPLTIPHSQMLDFMLIAEAKSFDKKIMDPEKVKIPMDVFVEVTDGPFKGVQGYLTHIAGKQRVVSASGLCIIATGYVSSYNYRVIERKQSVNHDIKHAGMNI